LARAFLACSANDEETVKAYVELAGELGFELTAEQIASAVNFQEKYYVSRIETL
jgi:hypothetical protein